MSKTIRKSRLDVISELKKKFTGNNPSSWSKNSDKQLSEWYLEYILKDKSKEIEIY